MHNARRRTPFVKHMVHEITGSQDANGDYSGVGNEIDFVLKPSSTEVYQVDVLSIQILDTNMTLAKYGGITTPPGFVGLEVTTKDKVGNILFHLDTALEKITSNAELIAVFADNAGAFISFGFGDDMILASHRFTQKDMDFELDGRKGEYLAITLNDNFTGLSKHQFHVQGRILSHEYNRELWVTGKP